jgi:spermidine synthase
MFLLLTAAFVQRTTALAQTKTLYEKQSPFNTVLVTEDERGLRALLFDRGGVRQSVVKVGDPDHLELAYAKVVPIGLALVEAPERILVVGLGGGTIPGFLHKHYPRAHIDVVDIDPVVVEVAKRFFGFREDENLRAYVDDGRKFIERCREPYDIIFLDAFGADSIPYDLATREFLVAVRKALTRNGIVVGNVWSSYSNPLYESMVRTYQDVFDGLYVVDVQGVGNRILLALPRREDVNREELIRKARRISLEKQFRFDLGESVRHGFRKPGQEESGGRILRDQDKVKKAG